MNLKMLIRDARLSLLLPLPTKYILTRLQLWKAFDTTIAY